MIDMTSVLVALITGVLALSGTVATVMVSSSSQQAVLDERLKTVRRDIEGLADRVDNTKLVERMALQEQTTSTVWKRIDELKARIDRLEDK